MVTEISNLTPAELERMREQQLLPERYPNGELFLCDLGDVMLKDDTASMEHPIFALSTQPDTKERVYRHGDNEARVIPSARGMATIHDKDILIFAVSQIMEAKNRGLPYSRKVSFNAHDFLRFANRMTNGQAYEGLRAALIRLQGTVIETTIRTGDVEQAEGFGLIERYRVRRQLKDGTVTDWGITLSEWLFNAIEANEVLTIDRDYFRLRKPLERRIYEIARKHCGYKAQWKISVELLHKKTGVQSPLKTFRHRLAKIAKFNHLPTYLLTLDDEGFAIFVNTSFREKEERKPLDSRIVISGDAMEQVVDVAPGWDKYHLEQVWRSWMHDKGFARPKDPDAAFLGFCKKYAESRPRPV